MTTDCAFDHDEDQDFTRDFTASIDQDYITLFNFSLRLTAIAKSHREQI
jgi:hypothetical protein